MKKILFVFIFGISFLWETSFGQDSVSFPVKLDETGFREVIAKVDDLYISGQPDKESFAKLKSDGVTTIVNLRTPSEMENREYVPFDEAAVVDSLGMEYVHIPLGGEEYPYTPEAVKKFADAIANADGKVLLHCTVARRASHMFAAYLIQYKNFPPEKAIEYAKAVNFGDWPLEGLLDKKLRVEFE
ncbi:MAG: protein tyrosine phosphatase family protein [bacterium]|nr:protein tyrosine phosphatase family protein [bacterium]